jgi:hypothetical protein
MKRREFLFAGLGLPALGRGEPLPGALALSMNRAAKCCLAWLDPARDSFPTGGYEVAHDTGRWWDAMLRWQVATGNAIPAGPEAAMMRNIQRLAGNPAALLTNTPETGSPARKNVVNPHNLRESMLAYTALVRFRKSEWARERGRHLAGVMAKMLGDDGQMDFQQLAQMIGLPLSEDTLMVQRSEPGKWFDGTANTGRALEPVIEFSQVTGDESAARLADRIAAAQFRNVIGSDGKVRKEFLDREHVGHSHSYCGTLRGLLAYGLWKGREEYVQGVLNTYRRGLFGTIISESGWTPHDLGKIRFPDKSGDPVGEHASCGDIAQMALWLGLRAGQEDLLDDVERLVRARLLPSQINEPSSPRRDGAWGVYSHPFGTGAILDVFAAVLHSLADISEHVVTTADGAVSVNLHFTVDAPAVLVEASRDDRGRVKATSKKRQALRIRVPVWAPRRTLRLTSNARRLPLKWQGTYLSAGVIEAGKTVELEYDLPARKSVEVMPVSGRRFELYWRGDEVIGCKPEVPIYPVLQ